ncbi:hypothetical protein LP420_18500 [Massilia sp. B-10]|nr:hypothetical protein LP420_18500 [Massilia sp. B-10]
MRVSGHIPAGLRAHEALDAGFDEINHINQVMLNFLATPTTETRTLERFILLLLSGSPASTSMRRWSKISLRG